MTGQARDEEEEEELGCCYLRNFRIIDFQMYLKVGWSALKQ